MANRFSINCSICAVNGKQKYLGLFENLEDAKNAAIKARQELHGEFARFA